MPIFCVQTAALMGNLHKGDNPLASIALLGDFPILCCERRDDVVALQWDYAAFTPMADKFAGNLKGADQGQGSRPGRGLRDCFAQACGRNWRRGHYRSRQAGPRPSEVSSFWRGLLRLPLYLLLGVATAWAAGALYFDLPIGGSVLRSR